jgi:hypothetical protein
VRPDVFNSDITIVIDRYTMLIVDSTTSACWTMVLSTRSFAERPDVILVQATRHTHLVRPSIT